MGAFGVRRRCRQELRARDSSGETVAVARHRAGTRGPGGHFWPPVEFLGARIPRDQVRTWRPAESAELPFDTKV
jgi:hypothetical protein